MRQIWTARINNMGNASGPGVALNTSTTLIDVSPGAASNGALVIPANFLSVDDIIKVKASGFFSNTATPTLLLGVYYGGVAGVKLAATGAITTITGATAWPWELEYEMHVRSIGSSGTIIGSGKVFLPASLTQYQAAYPIDAAAQAAVTIDTTTAKALTVGAQWGTSSASNTLTTSYVTIESK